MFLNYLIENDRVTGVDAFYPGNQYLSSLKVIRVKPAGILPTTSAEVRWEDLTSS